jgi:hypothetical protein
MKTLIKISRLLKEKSSTFLRGIRGVIELHYCWILARWRPVTNNSTIKLNFTIVIASQSGRLRLLKWTLMSLILQKNIRTEIHVYFSQKDFFKVKKIQWLEKYGVQIGYVHDDLGVYSKLFGPIKDGLDKPILILDDDTFYPRKFLETFYTIQIEKNNLIIGTRGMRYVPNKLYSDLERCVGAKECGRDILLTGKGGVLYPVKFLDAIKQNLDFIELAPLCDDLWYFFMARSLGYEFMSINKSENILVDWPGESKIALRKINVDLKENDVKVNILKNYFGE